MLDSRPLAGALSGFRILDYTTAWAGPQMTTYLAEMGAEVIHVESIQYLDSHRVWSKWAPGAAGIFPDNAPGARPWERNAQFNQLNKDKLGVTLNLGDPRGVALFKRLAAISDVVVDNYKAGTTARFGLGYDDLKAIRPDIIVASCPAFGTTGPYATYTAWGNQIVAMTGHGLLLNYEGEDEPLPSNTYADPVAAIVGAFTIAAALLHRLKTGTGQYVEISLAEVLTGLLPEAILDFGMNGRIAQPLGNRNPNAAPWGVYRCQGDDAWVAICCQDAGDFLALCAAIDRPDLLAEPRFSTLASRIQNRRDLDAIISEWTSSRNKHAVADALQDAGVAAEAAQSLPEVLDDRQLAARNFFVPLEHPEAGTHRYPLQPAQLSRTAAHDYRPAPTYGQHNVHVLHGLLGVTHDELATLAADGVIGTEPLEDEERAKRP